MNLSQELKNYISKQEIYALGVTLFFAGLYFISYITLGEDNTVTLVLLGVLSLSILLVLSIDIIAELNSSSEEAEIEQPTQEVQQTLDELDYSGSSEAEEKVDN